jgi:3-dehydroquinate dehydratase-1
VNKLAEAAEKQLDVAKVAVMPQTLEDVLTLLSATLEAKSRLSIPLITMSMGKYGMVSRMIGGVFGTALTFAVGAQASAPGQVPIEELRTVLQTIENTMGN